MNTDRNSKGKDLELSIKMIVFKLNGNYRSTFTKLLCQMHKVLSRKYFI